MSYELILIYGLVSIFLGIGPAIIFAIWKFGIKKELWISWILGGFFWLLALFARIFIILYINSLPQTLSYRLVLFSFLAGLFETSFRVLLLTMFTRKTADTAEKIYMAGLGWGSGEAIYLHTINLSILLFITPDASLIHQLKGIEYILIFSSIERILAEIFHVCMMILVFYGIKDKLKISENSTPIENSFFTKDPKPTTFWILIVIGLHFAFDYIFVSLVASIGIFVYIFGVIWDGLLFYYLFNRLKNYPLFLNNLKKSENEK
jgi:uncharacterized membrane protein YhfC